MRRVLALILLAGLSPACSGDDPGGFGNSQITGIYSLRTIEGAPMPVTLSSSAQSETQIAGSELLIALNGTFRQVNRLNVREGSTTRVEIDTTNGTWNQTDNTRIVLTSSGADARTINGRWVGLFELQFEVDSATWVFRK